MMCRADQGRVRYQDEHHQRDARAAAVPSRLIHSRFQSEALLFHVSI